MDLVGLKPNPWESSFSVLTLLVGSVWPVQTRSRYDLSCVWWDVKPYCVLKLCTVSDSESLHYINILTYLLTYSLNNCSTWPTTRSPVQSTATQCKCTHSSYRLTSAVFGHSANTMNHMSVNKLLRHSTIILLGRREHMQQAGDCTDCSAREWNEIVLLVVGSITREPAVQMLLWSWTRHSGHQKNTVRIMIYMAEAAGHGSVTDVYLLI